MRFSIEYLTETTEQNSVCHAHALEAKNLLLAQMQALAWGGKAQRRFGAEGFQIRDLTDAGRIVAIETFDGPAPLIH